MSETIAQVLRKASQKLISQTNVPQLEAEILLAHVLRQPRSYLFSRSNEVLLPAMENSFWSLVNRREQGEPVAYLIGHREFWSLDLEITKEVLIPRPETELLVELVLEKMGSCAHVKLADLGTGSGAIAIAIAHERPQWEIYAADQSQVALNVALRNAKRLNIQNVIFSQGDWLDAFPAIQFDVIVSNPPYLANDDVHLQLGDLRFEPSLALISGKEGLDAIRKIVASSRRYLKCDGYLFLEHGYQQGEAVRGLLETAGYTDIETFRDLATLERVTFGKV